MESPSRNRESNFQILGDSSSGHVCTCFKLPPFSVHISDSGATSTRGGCSVSGLAGKVDVHVSTISPAQQSHSETTGHTGGRGNSDSPLVAETVVVSTPTSSLCGPSAVLSIPPRSSVSTGSEICLGKLYRLPASRLLCDTTKQQAFQTRSLGLPQHLGRPSTNCMYDDRWLCFTRWAVGQGFDPLSPTAVQIASFLYTLLDTHGLSPQTIKGYRTCLGSVLNRTGKDKVVLHNGT